MKIPQCPKCAGKMGRGHVLDQGHGGWQSPIELVMGRPNKTWTGNYDTSERTKYSLDAYRCEDCGFVEFYASSVER